MSTIDLVISYYKEELGWLEKYKDVRFNNIYLYNKGPLETNTPYIEIKLENIGRCDHTYLYHIIDKYDELADVTIFTTGSVDLPHKSEKLDFIIKRTLETNNSAFQGNFLFFYNVRDYYYYFQIADYESSYQSNKTNAPMERSKIKPFGKWYDTHFKGIDVDLASLCGIFSVSKKHIHQHPKEYYKNLIAEFPNNSNPEVGHYFERAWLAVFNPIPKECMTYNYILLPWMYILLAILIIVLTILYIKPMRDMAKKLFNKGLVKIKSAL